MNPGHTGGNHSPLNGEHQQQQHQRQEEQQRQQPVQDGPAIVSDEVLARRIKNRERQRRYRARKRLELETRKSCLSGGQYATLQNDIHFNLNPPPPPSPSPSPSSSHLSSFPEARAYNGGRNWKKDAREAANPSASGTSGARRNWKADARNKAVDKQA